MSKIVKAECQLVPERSFWYEPLPSQDPTQVTDPLTFEIEIAICYFHSYYAVITHLYRVHITMMSFASTVSSRFDDKIFICVGVNLW